MLVGVLIRAERNEGSRACDLSSKQINIREIIEKQNLGM